MYIELAEFLRCPGEHGDAYCVLVPEQMEGRTVMTGTVGCPTCQAEYPIHEGTVTFGEHPLVHAGHRADDVIEAPGPNAETLQALLMLDGPGGHVVLVGSAARLATELAALVEGVHFVGVNVPPGVHASPTLSLLTAPSSIPLRTAMARAAVVPAEFNAQPWLNEAARVLRRGGRVVSVGYVAGATTLREVAAAPDLWVGERVSDL